MPENNHTVLQLEKIMLIFQTVPHCIVSNMKDYCLNTACVHKLCLHLVLAMPLCVYSIQ